MEKQTPFYVKSEIYYINQSGRGYRSFYMQGVRNKNSST